MRIAITGGIAEGKSTVLDLLQKTGHSVASSDQFARQVFREREVQEELAELLETVPPISSDQLRQAMASSRGIRRSVNRIMHPRIGVLNEQSDATFFEVPLLIEACLQGRYDRLWVVTCGIAEQTRRLEVRYGDRAIYEPILRAQVSSRVRVAFADRIIRTNEPIEAVQNALSVAVSDTLG